MPYAYGVLFIGISSRMLLSNKGVGICLESQPFLDRLLRRGIVAHSNKMNAKTATLSLRTGTITARAHALLVSSRI